MPEQENQWTSRTYRLIAVAVAAVLLLCLLATVGVLFFLHLFSKATDQLTPLTILFAGVCFLIALASVVHSIVSLIIANDNIFCASGRPMEMAKSLYESGFLQSQTLLAILVVGVVCVLMSSKLVQPSEGLPILTFATGFALGRQFKNSHRGKVRQGSAS